MITNLRKQTVCEANKEVIELIWRLGRGVMYKKHIEAYMERFFARNSTEVWGKVKELEKADVVQRIRLHNIVVIKLKKFALRFLLGVDRDAIRAIEVTASKLMRTAYVNSILLHHLYEGAIISKLDYPMFLDRYCPYSTFFNSRHKAHEVLDRYSKKGVMQGTVLEEVDRLRAIERDSTSFTGRLKVENVDYSFNVNSMEQASTFIDYTTKKGGINIAILDDKKNLSGRRIAEKMMKTYNYLHDFFPFGTLFTFTVYVGNENRLKALTGHTNTKTLNNLINTKSKRQEIVYHSQYCTLNYVNLDLDKKLFGNQTLIIKSNIKLSKTNSFLNQ